MNDKKEVKYPHIKVKLVGKDGNVFNLIGIVQAALKQAKVPANEIDQFVKEVTNQDSYADVLNFLSKTVVVS